MLTANLEFKFIQSQFIEFGLQIVWLQAEIKHGAKKHITTNPAKNIQVESLHVFEIEQLGGLRVDEAIDLIGSEGRPESIVDIYDGDATTAAIEHAEEGCNTPEICSVTDARRNGD